MVEASKLAGRRIVSSKGNVFGETEGVEIDINTWQVPSLYVSLTDETTLELGFKKSFMSKVVVRLPTSCIAAVGDLITLNESVKNLKDVVEPQNQS